MRILIIEDEFNLADVIASSLKKENYTVDIKDNGIDGLDYALSNIYNLIILDVMLPSLNGFEVLKEIRKNNIDSKVIMLTAKSDLESKLSGFEYGADDYITKPFHIEELIARVNAQLRNKKTVNKDYIEAGNLRLNLRTSSLMCTKTNEKIEVGLKEFLLLEYLIQNKNLIISKEQIYNKVWGLDNEIESNNLEAYLSFIRKKIKIIGADINIKAIRGQGYLLEVKNEEIEE